MSLGKCNRCAKTVYQLEGLKVGPYTKEVCYHKMCFKCENEGCTWKLTLTSYKYFDGKVYCQNHCPMKGFSNKAHAKGKIDMESSSVAAAAAAPKLSTVNEQVRGDAGQKTLVGTDSIALANAKAAPKLNTVNEQLRGTGGGTSVGLDSISVSNAMAAPKASQGVNEQVRAVCPSCNARATGKFCTQCGSRIHTE